MNVKTFLILTSLILVVCSGALGLAIYLQSKEAQASLPDMITLPPGQFVMKVRQQSAALPGRAQFSKQVSLDQPITISRREVTFAEFDACVADGGCSHHPDDRGRGRGNRPVSDVSWADADQYARWLTHKTGQHYRLPTEEEWEYAKRQAEEGQAQIEDLTGPVWEWTLSCWSRSETRFQEQHSPEQLARPDHCYIRILRGESRTHSSDFVRRAYGGGCNPEQVPDYFGFRLVRAD